ncbi:MerR family transcriptional regulator [Streptomyces sp. HNM0575]|uniref:MerR family transcriptional regulator n=1 Tax=Streptomyces sp. HNM0575 TaxID=2716338 RepID=UPI00145D5CE8|nr:MerR family transcriptional regulator [Streptomyces sp. HNM0575]NLU74085.1 MerR family transcriptional regulator [Streptomyces sp. HNM0575]
MGEREGPGAGTGSGPESGSESGAGSGAGGGLLTIGAFAKASRLSAKALRLYDELGLLCPARVDPVSGYRFYAPAQLEQARLVVWLRRLGMPLARIRELDGLDGPAAAREIRAYWAQVENDVAVRRDMAAFLIDHLSRKDSAMPHTDESSAAPAPLAIRYAALTDAGLVRKSNQDAAYAGSRLLAVADGFGGSGGPASAAAVETFRQLEEGGLPAADLLNVLDDTIDRAGRAVGDVVASAPDADEAGTTLTAMLWTGSQLALVHIGDTRAYLLRDGDFFQITHDHTLVQSMLDEGRISEEEAASHPQRALLMRALGARSPGSAGGSAPGSPGTATAERPDVRLQDVRAGDRYLLCSDGLTSVVPDEQVRRTVAGTADPEETARELVALAHRSGAPDNISCVVADVVEGGR